MILERITCSDMRQHNRINDILYLGTMYPMAEFAIQAHPSKFSPEMPRYKWFEQLIQSTQESLFPIQLAMHVNSEWRTQICQGIIPYEIKRLWDMQNADKNPVIRRVQININGGKYQFRTSKVADIIRAYPGIEFIFQYSSQQADRIKRLDKTGVSFSLLFDESGGRGRSPGVWLPPIMSNHKMGYSGGLGPENVIHNLNQINQIVPKETHVWIDAEGKLKNPYTQKFDIKLAKQYLENAYQWNRCQR